MFLTIKFVCIPSRDLEVNENVLGEDQCMICAVVVDVVMVCGRAWVFAPSDLDQGLMKSRFFRMMTGK